LHTTKSNLLPRIAVLLATSHPDESILEQIDSIKKQSGVFPVIYWGDYSSSHDTRVLIRNALMGSEFHEININSSGVAFNFFELLKISKENFVAFSDQDDIWLPEKLKTHISLMQNSKDIPALVHSNSIILKKGKTSTKLMKCGSHTPESLFFSNCCQGCTMTLNAAARALVLKNLQPKIFWHDWWVALVISTSGNVIYSDKPDTLYRLHSKNTIGMPKFHKKILRYLIRPEGLVSYQIENILNLFPHTLKLSPEEIAKFRLVLSKRRAVRLLGVIRNRKILRGNLSFFRSLLLIVKRP